MSQAEVFPPQSAAQLPTDVPALEVIGLHKSFGDKQALRDLSLAVPQGSIYAVVGPNGAGKTTMLNIATGLMRPDSGQAFICGHDIWADPVPAKTKLGLLADGLPVFDRLTGNEYLVYLGALRKLDQQEVIQRAEALLTALNLTDSANVKIVDYSAGMTKKILLAGALLHNPRVVVLDEPLEAVDPVSGQVIQKLLRTYAAAGGTVVLSSHVMNLVEGLCDQVAIIHEGSVRIHGAVEELSRQQTLTELFVSVVGAADLDEQSLSWLGGSEGAGN